MMPMGKEWLQNQKKYMRHSSETQPPKVAEVPRLHVNQTAHHATKCENDEWPGHPIHDN